MQTSRTQYLILTALLLVAIFLGYHRYTDSLTTVSVEEKIELSAMASGEELEEGLQGLKRQIGGAIAPALISSSVEKGAWRSREIARHRLNLAPGTYDYIVLPVQEFHPEIDRPSSLLSAHHIARAVEARTGKKVMSPELALRLLGGRANVFDDNDVRELALSAGAEVVHIYHPGNLRRKAASLSVFLVLTDSAGNVTRYQGYPIDSPSLARPLDTIIEPLAQEIVAGFFNTGDTLLTQAPQVADAPEVTQALWRFPDNLEEIPRLAVTTGQQAAYLQFLAMLTPEEFEYDRRRLFERSLLSLQSVDLEHPNIRLLKARALFYLSRRPAALQILGSPRSPAEQALVELMNGNYPELEALVPAIDDQLLRVMARAELAELGVDYKKGVLTATGEGTLSAQWQVLLDSVYQDADYWYAPDNLVFFPQLAGLFPGFDQQFELATLGQLVSGEMSASDAVSNVLDTVFEQGLRPPMGPGCCATYGPAVEDTDLWTLYRNLFLANLLRQLNRSINVHVAYETAQALAENIEPYLSGHPRYSRLYSEALEGKAKRSQGSEKKQLLSRAKELALETRINSAYTDIDTIRTDYIVARLGGGGNPAGRFTGKRTDYPSAIMGVSIQNAGDALQYFHNDIGLLKRSLVDRSLTEQQVQKILTTRLNGHPERPVFLAELLVRKGERKQAIALLRDHLESGGDGDGPYEMLGELLIEEQDYSGAKAVFLQYPLFENPPAGQRVKVSNIADTYGSRLYWLGRHKEAVPFYEIALGLNTGAGSQYSSGGRLALMAGDYITALQFNFQRGKRYNNRFAYRNYFVLLHLMGQHEDAEAGAQALIPRYKEPQIWTSLFVGHRIQKRSISEIEKWIDESLGYHSNPELDDQANRYIFLSSLIDRNVSEEKLNMVSTLFTPESGNRILSSQETPLLTVVSPYLRQLDGAADNCPPDSENCQGRGVLNFPGEYQVFLQACHHLQKGEAGLALSDFALLDRQLDIVHSENAQYIMPYFMMAATGALPSEGIRTILEFVESRDPASVNFDYELSKAVLYAGLGEREKAIDAINTAYISRPHTLARPIFSWYQLTEVAQWMSSISGDQIYIEMALDWARRYQVIQPQFGWAYAFEARYSSVEKDRIRAAAFAQYLDEDSRWLSQVPKEIQDDALDWWRSNNPFSKEALERATNTTAL